MTLPDQRPVSRPASLRPRKDRPWLPTFRERMVPRQQAHPIEAYDPAKEARPFELRELRDPKLWLEGGLAVAIGIIALVVILSSGPQVTP